MKTGDRGDRNTQPGSNAAAAPFAGYVAEKAYCINLTVSLGQVKTLVENPYSMTHSIYLKAGAGHRNGQRTVEPGGIRLSVGLEDRHDLIADLEQALEHV